MWQEARLFEHDANTLFEVRRGRLETKFGELLAGRLIAQFGLVAECEQCLSAARVAPLTGDVEYLVDRHEHSLAAFWRLRERAVVADVTAQHGQRDEHLWRVGHDYAACRKSAGAGGRAELGEIRRGVFSERKRVRIRENVHLSVALSETWRDVGGEAVEKTLLVRSWRMEDEVSEAHLDIFTDPLDGQVGVIRADEAACCVD